MSPESLQPSSAVGSRENAWAVVRKMFAESKAYREFVLAKNPQLNVNSSNVLPDGIQWDDVPIVTKSSFYSKYSLFDLIPESNKNQIYSYIRSSGSQDNGTSRGFFWPQLLEDPDYLARGFSEILQQIVSHSDRKTLFIVGLSLGSWAGGEQIGFMTKLSALTKDLPLVVFSPGNQHEEILEMIQMSHEQFEHVVIACCPSAIYYILKRAELAKVEFPLNKITFLVTGEPFAEELRLELQKRAGPRRSPVMYSLYGSADSGFSGIESNHLIQLRQFALENPRIVEKLGLEPGAMPNFFHLNYQYQSQYFERINGELVITTWQGLPLVRYNLQDRVQFFSWKHICEVMVSELTDARQKKLWDFLGSQALPDVVAVYGRTQGCLFLCGTNVFDSMLEEVVLESSLLASKRTGHFVVWISEANAQQQLHWQIEVQDPSLINDEFVHKVYAEFCDSLGRLQPEFKEDFEKLYSRANKPEERIFQFHFCAPGTVEKHPKYHTGIKRKLIQNGKL